MNKSDRPARPDDQPTPSTPGSARHGPKRERLLVAAAGLMARQGFGQTSIRDVARETGFSLAGMYYYFKNKEDLLYQIQQRTFSALLDLQEEALVGGGSPEDKLRRLVHNHLDYFTRHANEVKVCTFELQSLRAERYDIIAELRRRYFRCPARVVGEILGLGGSCPERNRLVRHYTLFIFGMLNWIFMWYDPERDTPVEAVGDEMIALVLDGLRGHSMGH
jgi:AcrR family transcriptional regulator